MAVKGPQPSGQPWAGQRQAGRGGQQMTAPPAGIAGLDQITQVKLPVTDLARSVTWHRRLLDQRLWTELAEDGVLRGTGLIDPQSRQLTGLPRLVIISASESPKTRRRSGMKPSCGLPWVLLSARSSLPACMSAC
jgi:hypothetical protein